jgi:hypothetical protein
MEVTSEVKIIDVGSTAWSYETFIKKTEHLRMDQTAQNICEKCDNKPHVFSFDVADTGRCSKCGNIGECWDHNLINHYKTLSLTDEQIHKYLPRLINPNIDNSAPISLPDLGLRIQKVFTED